MNTGPKTLAALANIIEAFDHLGSLGFEMKGEMSVNWYGETTAVLRPSRDFSWEKDRIRVGIGDDL